MFFIIWKRKLMNASHVQYLLNLDNPKALDYHLSEHLRLNGIYWGTTCLYLLNQDLPKDQVVERVLSCRHPNGE